jgi:hypothetical protein
LAPIIVKSARTLVNTPLRSRLAVTPKMADSNLEEFLATGPGAELIKDV